MRRRSANAHDDYGNVDDEECDYDGNVDDDHAGEMMKVMMMTMVTKMIPPHDGDDD